MTDEQAEKLTEKWWLNTINTNLRHIYATLFYGGLFIIVILGMILAKLSK